MRAEAVPIQQEPAFDRLLDVLAEHIVENFLQELEAEPRAPERNRQEGAQ